jgi:hypothetical protein
MRDIRYGWLITTDMDYGLPCCYGLDISGIEGNLTGECRPCGKPAVYRMAWSAILGCEEHAQEMAAHDERLLEG